MRATGLWAQSGRCYAAPMPANPPENMPRISPYLYYEDVASALDWLSQAFGFRERHRIAGPGGKVVHAEMALADGVIMMGNPGPDYRNPKRLGQTTQNIYVYVDDVEAHFRHAQATGAKILEEPKDQFYRRPPLWGRGSRRAPVVLRPARTRRDARGDEAATLGPHPPAGGTMIADRATSS